MVQYYNVSINNKNQICKQNHFRSILTSLFVPISFMLRRMIFCLTMIFWIDFFWGQVAIQMFISVLMVILLQWSNLFNSKLMKFTQTYNEVMSIFALYMFMCFSDFNGDPMTRSQCGWAFIGVVCLFAFVHIAILLSDVY